MLTGHLLNYEARYHIVRIDGWILSTSDDPPTLAELQAIAKECGRSVYLTAPTETGDSEEIGYACPRHSQHDYISQP